jgi:C1A family cysteine protease
MKTSLAALGFVVACHASMPIPSEEDLWKMFTRFQQKHKKGYQAEHVSGRFAAFKENIAKAITLNEKHGSTCTDLFDDCLYGVTPFSDMTKDEFKRKMTGLTLDKSATELSAMGPSRYAHGLAVQSKDWRTEGKVSPIKDQNPCGVCWAFSAAATIESAYAIKYDTSPPILSPEMIIDCDGTHDCDGKTSGGIYTQAWDWLKSEGGISSLSAYPITCCDETEDPKIGTCPATREHEVKVTGYSKGPQNEDDLAAAIATQGPFSIAVAADAWQTWKGGSDGKAVMTDCPGDVDHAVSIIGFDKTADTPYWMVRNQWGTSWGDEGYIYLAYGNNTCQLTTLPAIAEVSKATSGADVIV